MSDLRPIPSVTVSMVNQTNGAKTTYNISVVSFFKIQSLDKFTIDFPPEITLPFDAHCSSPSPSILDLTCKRLRNHTIEF